MRLEPRPQLRRNLKAVNELISLRCRVVLFHFLHDVRVALGEDVKRELAHGFRPRRCRRDARDEFDRASIALRLRTTHKNKCAQRHTHTENSCFSHVKIVTELQNQKAELPAPYPEPINQRSSLELQTAYPPLALFLRSLASFSISSVFLTMWTESTSVVVVFWTSSRNSLVNWYSRSTPSRNSFSFCCMRARLAAAAARGFERISAGFGVSAGCGGGGGVGRSEEHTSELQSRNDI